MSVIPWVISLVGILVGSGGVAVFLRAKSENRKLAADAGVSEADAQSKIFTTSNALIDTIYKEIGRLNTRVDELEGQERRMRQEGRDREAELAVVTGWARLMYSAVKQQGLEVPNLEQYRSDYPAGRH
jgi:hypothetical protein